MGEGDEPIVPGAPTCPRICLVARTKEDASAVLQTLREAGMAHVEVHDDKGLAGRGARGAEADLVWLHGSLDGQAVRRWLDALGGRVQAVALEGDVAANEHGVRPISRASFVRGEGALRTRLNLLAAEARNQRRARGRRRSSVVLAPRRAMRSGSVSADAVVFLGSSGAPEQLRHLLPSAGRPAVPVLLAVHHPPSQRTAFRSMLTRLSGGPMGLFTPPGRDLPPGLYVVPAPLGREVPGPDLDGLVDQLLAEGLRLLVCLGSGMGEDGVAGARRAREAGGRVVVVEPEACVQPSMVEAARQAGVVDERLTVLEMADLWSRVRAGACVANDGARRSPAA